MTYNVVTKKRILKSLKKLPFWVQKKMAALVNDLKEKGPEQANWQNYSKLNKTEFIVILAHLGWPVGNMKKEQ